MNIDIRKAAISDTKEIKKLLSYYFLNTDDVEREIHEFIVALNEGKIVGCASLHMNNTAELKNIAVLPAFRNMGVGSKLVDSILDQAARLTDTVYLRTMSPSFFKKKGFQVLENKKKKDIWDDCAECHKFDICRQTLMRKETNQIFNFND